MPDVDVAYEQHQTQVRDQLKRPGPPKERRRIDGNTIHLVGTEERVDQEWENEEAQRRRFEFEQTREDRLKDRQAERAKLTAGQRLDKALLAIGLHEGGMRSRSIASLRGSGGVESGKPASAGCECEDIQETLVLLAHHIEAVERKLDELDGLQQALPEGDRPGAAGGYSNARMMRLEERDRIVFDDFQGIRSEDVAREAPYLGSSARTIERARVNEAKRRELRVRPIDGVVLGPAELAA